MKYTSIITILIVSFICMSASLRTQEESIKFMSYDEAVKEAERKHKLIFIDVYTSWCGWCKVMDKSTFTDADVMKYSSKKYVAVKLDAEGAKTIHYKNIPLTEREFAQKILQVSSYPTTVYLDHKQEILSNVPGYLEAKVFKKVLVYFAEDHYKTTSWQEFEKNYHE